jgi:hypothetical protein
VGREHRTSGACKLCGKVGHVQRYCLSPAVN